MNGFNIEQFLDLKGYDTEERVKRRKNNDNATAEYFTPYSIVKKMADKIPEDYWKDPDRTFLEPSCGNGQILIYMIYKRIMAGIDWRTALNTAYGLDIMQDNVNECKERIHVMIKTLTDDYDKEEAERIMDRNIVCNNFFTWNFEEWREMTEEEINNLIKQKKLNKKYARKR